MFRFLFGFIAAVVIMFLAGFLWLRLGFVDARADAPEMRWSGPSPCPRSMLRYVGVLPNVHNPVDATDDNLIAGMKVYQNHCAGCHGDIGHPHAVFGDSFSPRAPQFLEDAPDMPEEQNFYIIQHGIRLSGMPASRTTHEG